MKSSPEPVAVIGIGCRFTSGIDSRRRCGIPRRTARRGTGPSGRALGAVRGAARSTRRRCAGPPGAARTWTTSPGSTPGSSASPPRRRAVPTRGSACCWRSPGRRWSVRACPARSGRYRHRGVRRRRRGRRGRLRAPVGRRPGRSARRVVRTIRRLVRRVVRRGVRTTGRGVRTGAGAGLGGAGLGGALCGPPNRLSRFLDLRGPSVAVDTACSSALVAVDQACRALRTDRIPFALAGAVSLISGPGGGLWLDAAGALSPTAARSPSTPRPTAGAGEGCGSSSCGCWPTPCATGTGCTR
ncbi:beta-ketoacyl synthase N-terminal-like domain-containing protein [Streptomyces sp. M19]